FCDFRFFEGLFVVTRALGVVNVFPVDAVYLWRFSDDPARRGSCEICACEAVRDTDWGTCRISAEKVPLSGDRAARA
ncbi:MAG: hypothetical protein LUH07_11165, partial [Lachnospiraceae bacterium]|nr:hypothetical protein [Lachnospiraceae bacterium]